jgi:hypothetical protein
MATPKRSPPKRNPFGIDAAVAASTLNRGLEVLLLTRNTNKLARCAVALSEVPIIKGQRGEAGVGKGLRNSLNRWCVLRAAEAGSHHNTRHLFTGAGRVIDVADTGRSARVKAYLGSLNRDHDQNDIML